MSTATSIQEAGNGKFDSLIYSETVVNWRARIRGTTMLLNATDAALYLSVSRSKFYKWLKEGRIKPSVLDKQRYCVYALDSLVEASAS